MSERDEETEGEGAWPDSASSNGSGAEVSDPASAEVDAAVPDVAAVHLDAAVDDTPVAPEADSASHAMLHNLATAFRTMPPEQLGGVLDILLRGNHVQPDDAGEIEIELEALSSDTVHELHHYVMGLTNSEDHP